MELKLREFTTLPLKTLEDIKSRFSNHRQWRDFVAAVQCSVNYSTAALALGHDVLQQRMGARIGASQAGVKRSGCVYTLQ